METNTSPKAVWLPTMQSVNKENPEEILFVEADGKTCIVHKFKTTLDIQISINEVEEILSKFGFYRCHKSFLVNMDKVNQWCDKALEVFFENGEKALVSKDKKAEFKELLFGGE
jgi:DNA-binding LytR/AlgR family response regulator